MHTKHPGAAVEWTATGQERPVFLDERGRRRRWVRLAGALAGVASSLWLGGLIAGAVGFGTLPLARPPLAARPAAGGAALDRLADASVGRRSHRPRGVVVAERRGNHQLARLAVAPPAGRSALGRRS